MESRVVTTRAHRSYFLSTRHSVVAYSVVFQRPMYLHLV